VVKPHGWERSAALKTVPPGALISCTEMSDNHTHVFSLGEFMARCYDYIKGGWVLGVLGAGGLGAGIGQGLCETRRLMADGCNKFPLPQS